MQDNLRTIKLLMSCQPHRITSRQSNFLMSCQPCSHLRTINLLMSCQPCRITSGQSKLWTSCQLCRVTSGCSHFQWVPTCEWWCCVLYHSSMHTPMARVALCCSPQNSRQCQDCCLHTVTRIHVQPHTWNYIHYTKNNMGYNQMHFYKRDYSAANNVYYTIYYNRSFQHTTWYHHHTMTQHFTALKMFHPWQFFDPCTYIAFYCILKTVGVGVGGYVGGCLPPPPPFFCFCVSENRHNIYIHTYMYTAFTNTWKYCSIKYIWHKQWTLNTDGCGYTM